MTIARSSSKRQTAASSGSRRPTNRSGNDAGSKISLTGRSTCASASALNFDAQPAQVERVVRRISRPVCGIGIKSPNKKWKVESSIHFLLSKIHKKLSYGVVVGGAVVGAVVAGDVDVSGNGKIN